MKNHRASMHQRQRGPATGVALLLFFVPTLTARGQVVQLPEMHVFSVDTSVLVPDSGGATLGGVSRSYNGSASRGVPGWSVVGPLGRSRAVSTGASAGGVSVHATVIDHEEIDKRLLEEARRGRSSSVTSAEPTPAMVRNAPIASLANIRAELAAEDAQREAEADLVYRKGLACEQRREWKLARTYYELAMRKSPQVIRAQAAERLAVVKAQLSKTP